MSNIINVKEENNILSFVGDVLNVVANSTNFYLQFDLDDEWDENSIVTAIFNFDGVLEQVELNEERMCKIPPTSASKILFCITTEPAENEKLSSTILTLNVEPSGETFLDGVPVYENAHVELLGLIEDLLQGRVNAMHATLADSATTAGHATTADSSLSQVSLTGDEQIAGEKNFVGTIKHNSNAILDSSQMSNANLIINGDFVVNQREVSNCIRNGTDIYTADRWLLRDNNGTFKVSTKTLTGTDPNGPTVLCQWIEDFDIMAYKTVTFSATINDVRYSGTYTFGKSISADSIYNFVQTDTFTFRIFLKKTLKKVGVQFLAANGESLVIREVKAEISDVETRYIGKPYPEEILCCQRYYIKARIYTTGLATSATGITFLLPLPTTFKQVKTITMVSYPTIVSDDGTTQVATSLTLNQNTEAGVIINVVGENLVANKFYYLIGGLIKIDGEYY